MQKNIKKLIQAELPAYQGRITKMKLLTGLTNQTFRVEAKNMAALLYKHFGGNFNRQLENKICRALAQKGIAPQVIFASQTDRIEQFIEGGVHPSFSTTFTDSHNLVVVEKVLRELWQFHHVEVEEMKSSPTFLDNIFSDSYCEKVLAKEDTLEHHRFNDFKQIFQSIHSKLKMQKQCFLPVQAYEKMCFCHNDLNNLNIMEVPQEDGPTKIIFIDFEYSSYNYPAYDLADFFVEIGINYQVDSYPYFQVMGTWTLPRLKEACSKYKGYYPNMEIDVLGFMVICNLYWLGWTILMIDEPATANFGIIEHGQMRIAFLKQYWEMFLEVYPQKKSPFKIDKL